MAAKALFFKSDLSPIGHRNYEHGEQSVKFPRYNDGAKEHPEHTAVYGMPNKFVWTGADQFMIDFRSYRPAPISSEMPSGPNRQKS